MNRFLKIVAYEYSMSIRRRGFWLAYGLLFLFYGVSILMGADLSENLPTTNYGLLQYAGQMIYFTNMFMPVIGGIAIADRLVRDHSLGVAPLLESTPLPRWPYILGKYAAALLAVLSPVLLLSLALAGVSLAAGAPLSLLPFTLLAFLAIAVPGYAFVTAFSLACPLVMPLRVYQILFTGYWFWGNYLNPQFLPSLNGTLLTPGGKIVFDGLFNRAPDGSFANSLGISGGPDPSTPLEAWLNLLVLAGCVVVVLVCLERFLAWRSRRA